MGASCYAGSTYSSAGAYQFFYTALFQQCRCKQKKAEGNTSQFYCRKQGGFFKNCRLKLNDIDREFESYCRLGKSAQVEAKLDTALANFMEFVVSQQVIDQQILATIKQYSEFVAEATLELKSAATSDAKSTKAYQDSKVLFKESIAAIDKGIQQLQE